MFDVYNQYIKGQPSSYFTYINLVIVAVNAMAGLIVHFILFGKRRKNERLFQLEASLYDKLVVGNIDGINKFFSDTQEVVMNLLNVELRHNMPNKVLLSRVQDACDKIQSIYDAFEQKYTPAFSCYSSEFYKYLINCSDQFSSESMSLVSSVTVYGYVIDEIIASQKNIKTKYQSLVLKKLRHVMPSEM